MTDLIPGCVRAISIHPAPQRPIALRDTRALHGVLTGILGGHRSDGAPAFTLLPWSLETSCGWAVQFVEHDGPRESGHHISLFDESRILSLGPRMRLRLAPRPAGPAMLCIDTITPVSIRCTMPDGRSLYRVRPRPEHIVSALRSGRRIATITGRDYRRDERESMRLTVLADATHVECTPIGNVRAGSWSGGKIYGWAGRLVLQADETCTYLLRLAELVGLGGRTALGFGRFRLREVTR